MVSVIVGLAFQSAALPEERQGEALASLICSLFALAIDSLFLPLRGPSLLSLLPRPPPWGVGPTDGAA